MTSHIALISLAGITLAMARSVGPRQPTSSPTGVAACDSNRFMMTGARGILEAVDVYPAATADTTTLPIRSLRGEHTTLCQPRDLAVDTRGRLHVLNRGSINVYERGSAGDTAPVRSIPGGGFGFGLDRTGNIYVGTDGAQVRDSGSITVHAPTGRRDGAPKRTPLGRYSRRRPQGIAADDGGRIYTSLPGDTVLIFAASASGHYKTAQVLAGPATGLKRPFGLAIDRRGNLYVANNAGSTITVYAPGSVGDASPIRTIEPVRARTMLQNPNFLAFDGHDTLYVGMPGGILVYSPKATGEVAPVRSIPTYYSIGIAVGRDRTLYVLSERNLLRVFGPGATDSTPLRTIHPAPPFRFSAFALGSRDRLYLTAYTDTAAIIYRTGARGTLPLARRFYGPSSMLSRPIGIAVDRQDQVYVANGPQPMPHGAIRVYGATATGDTLPDRLIAGQATQLSQPTDIAVNTRGEMFAVNTNWRSAGWITVHSSGADGNAAPIRTISGPNTLLRQPIKLAIGTGDTVFVLNAFNLGKYGTANVTVTVYGPKAAGNIDPVRTITVTGGQTVRGGRFPTGIAVDARGSVYLSDYGSNFVSVYGPGAKGAVLPARRIRLRPAEDANGRAWTYMGGAAIAIGPRNELFVAAFPQQMVFTRREVRPNGKASDPEVAPLSLTLGGAYSR